MNIFFDIDDTLIAPGTRKLRPWSQWCVKHLRDAGHIIYLWSHGGKKNCKDVAIKLQVPPSKCFAKPGWDNFENHKHIIDNLGALISIDLCIDDDPQDMPAFYPGMTVLPYCADFTPEQDKEMLRVLDSIAPGMDKRRGAKSYLKQMEQEPNFSV